MDNGKSDKPLVGFSVGVTETLEHVTFNLPPDELTPTGATLLLTAEQTRTLIDLLQTAAAVVEGIIPPGGH